MYIVTEGKRTWKHKGSAFISSRFLAIYGITVYNALKFFHARHDKRAILRDTE